MIEAVLPRNNKLSRQAAGESGEEQVLAANLDVLFLVTSLNRDLSHMMKTPTGLPLALLFVVLGSYNLRFPFRTDLQRPRLDIYHDIVMGNDAEMNSSYTTATGSFKPDFDVGLLAWLDQTFILKGNFYPITIISLIETYWGCFRIVEHR